MSDNQFILSAIAAAVISVFGVARRNYWALYIGGVLFLPVCSYLNTSPSFRGIFLLPLFHLGAAYALYKQKQGLAWVSLLPALMLTIFLSLVALVFGVLMEEGVVY